MALTWRSSGLISVFSSRQFWTNFRADGKFKLAPVISLSVLVSVTATNAAIVNRILQRDTVVQHDGPSIAKVPPYARFYNYDPKQNRRSIIHRNPYIPREKAS